MEVLGGARRPRHQEIAAVFQLARAAAQSALSAASRLTWTSSRPSAARDHDEMPADELEALALALNLEEEAVDVGQDGCGVAAALEMTTTQRASWPGSAPSGKPIAVKMRTGRTHEKWYHVDGYDSVRPRNTAGAAAWLVPEPGPRPAAPERAGARSRPRRVVNRGRRGFEDGWTPIWSSS